MLNFAFPLSPRTHQPRMTGLASLKGYVQVEEEKKSFVKKKKKKSFVTAKAVMKLMWFIHRPGIMCTKCFLFLEIFMLKSIPLYQKNSFSKYTGLDARRTRRRLTKPDKSRQESSWTIMRAQQTQMNNQNKGGLACSLPLEGPWGV